MSDSIPYDVHLFAVVRFQVPSIVAESPQAAVGAARDHPAVGRWLRRLDNPQGIGEFADEFSHYLVDVADDPDLEQSRWFHSAESPLLQIPQSLVRWDETDRPPAVLEELLVAARHALSNSL